MQKHAHKRTHTQVTRLKNKTVIKNERLLTVNGLYYPCWIFCIGRLSLFYKLLLAWLQTILDVQKLTFQIKVHCLCGNCVNSSSPFDESKKSLSESFNHRCSPTWWQPVSNTDPNHKEFVRKWFNNLFSGFMTLLSVGNISNWHIPKFHQRFYKDKGCWRLPVESCL